MASGIHKLTTLQVQNKNRKGRYSDGNGLYLQVTAQGNKSWIFRYKYKGKSFYHGLGAYSKLNSLSKARAKAAECKELLKSGINPIEHKAKLAQKQSDALTFQQCAEKYIQSHKHGWKNVKHTSQWTNTLTTYAFPIIGKLPVQSINIKHILKILDPIWRTKTETASRVRQRIENILDWATVMDYRQGDNPALWRGRLDKLLPKRTKVQKPQHFVAMDYRILPAYFRTLRAKDTIACKALAFTILTASRNGESRSFSYSEFMPTEALWIIPENRMKAGKEHRVPLCNEALKIIEEMKYLKQKSVGYVFEGMKEGTPISEAALLKEVKLKDSTLTVHGFRSSFRDWCAEQTNYPREVAEAALAHSLKDKTEAAYQRGDILEKRRALMDDWAKYCLSGS